MSRSRYRWALASPLALAACSTPADVTADHERAMAEYERAIRDELAEARDEVNRNLDELHAANAEYPGNLAVAESWDSHWWGIPAGGWVAILVIASILLAVALITWIYLAHERRRVRRRREHDLALEREKTERKRIQALEEAARRGNCQVCHAAPISAEVLAEIEEDRRERR